MTHPPIDCIIKDKWLITEVRAEFDLPEGEKLTGERFDAEINSGERHEYGIYDDAKSAYAAFEQLRPGTNCVDWSGLHVRAVAYEIEPIRCRCLDDGYVLSYHSIDAPERKIAADIREANA